MPFCIVIYLSICPLSSRHRLTVHTYAAVARSTNKKLWGGWVGGTKGTPFPLRHAVGDPPSGYTYSTQNKNKKN